MRIAGITYGAGATTRAAMDIADVGQLATGLEIGNSDKFVHGFTIGNAVVHGVGAFFEIVGCCNDKTDNANRYGLMGVADGVACVGSGLAAAGVWQGFLLSADGSLAATLYQASKAEE